MVVIHRLSNARGIPSRLPHEPPFARLPRLPQRDQRLQQLGDALRRRRWQPWIASSNLAKVSLLTVRGFHVSITYDAGKSTI